jgi:segregation and condensation protein A
MLAPVNFFAPLGRDEMGSPPAGAVLNAESASSPYRVALPEFEGPLDLLLHLCKTHEIEIVNIPIAFITTKYLEYLEVMQTMPVDVAADYLVMAATLAYLKSRELVPQPEPLEASIDAGLGEDDALDPREELIRRLLEYQKYKDAAEKLGGRPIEGRNVFGRGASIDVDDPVAAPLADHSVWKLIAAFGKILEKAAPHQTHDVVLERVSIADRINQLVDRLQGGGGAFRFDSCFDLSLPEPELRHQVVVTLLAILELARLKVIRVLQAQAVEGGEAEGTLFVTHVDGSDLEAARCVLVTSVEEEGPDDVSDDEDTDAGSSEDDETAADSTLVEPAPAGADDASMQERGEE